MRQLLSRLANLRSSARDASGFTLIEMIVVCALLSIVVGALMAPLITAQKVQTSDANYASAQQDARNGVDLMVAEIRQATVILSDGPNFVEMDVTLGGVAEHVLYECDIPQAGTSYNQCVRDQAAAGSTLPPLTSAAVSITNLLNGTPANPVFSWGPDSIAPYYMTATVQVPASDGSATSELHHTIVVSDGALMRNQNVAN